MTITTTTTFADAPVGFKLPDDDTVVLYGSPDEVPVEMFIRYTKSILLADSSVRPYYVLNSGLTPGLTTSLPDIYLNGLYLDPTDTSGQWGSPAVKDSAGNIFGTMDAYDGSGGLHSDIQIGGYVQPGAAAAYAIAPPKLELVYRGVASAGNAYTSGGGLNTPDLDFVMGFRPRADWAGPNMTFVDNLAWFGGGYFEVEANWNTTNFGEMPAGDRNLFAGFLKREAMDKAVRDITNADIAFGVRIVNTAYAFVVNGVVELSGTIPADGCPYLFFDYFPVGDMRGAPVAALDTIPISVSSLYGGVSRYAANGFGSWQETINVQAPGTYDVHYAGTVIAMKSDMDLSGKPVDQYWSYGYHSANVGISWENGMVPEGLYGMFYTSPPVPPFWTNKLKTTEILE